MSKHWFGPQRSGLNFTGRVRVIASQVRLCLVPPVPIEVLRLQVIENLTSSKTNVIADLLDSKNLRRGPQVDLCPSVLVRLSELYRCMFK